MLDLGILCYTGAELAEEFFDTRYERPGLVLAPVNPSRMIMAYFSNF